MIKKVDQAGEGLGQAAHGQGRQVARSQIEDIAKIKMKDLNAASLDAAVKIIGGAPARWA